jgi:carboxypeptidase D
VINVPPTDFIGYNYTVFNNSSLPSALEPLRSVIERTNNTVIAHGYLDYILLANGTLMTIQNMTWNGAQGFQKLPIEPPFVPYHESLTQLQNGTPSVRFLDNAGAG